MQTATTTGGDSPAGLAHELKNALAAVKALVQLLVKDAAEPRTRARLEVALAEVLRMEAILRAHLARPRPAAPERRPLDLGELADDVVAVLEARAASAEVTLVRHPSTATVTGDAPRLRSALLNLVGNAIEATAAGGQVDLEVQERDGWARIDIRDSGKGLSPHELAQIGTPFFTLREDGTGLGVMLARWVVTEHGGSLDYESELGRGTTARVTLPVEPRA